jgi:hypothetical protein
MYVVKGAPPEGIPEDGCWRSAGYRNLGGESECSACDVHKEETGPSGLKGSRLSLGRAVPLLLVNGTTRSIYNPRQVSPSARNAGPTPALG